MEAVWEYHQESEQQTQLFETLREVPQLSLIPDLALQHLIRKGFTNVEDISKLFYSDFRHLHDFRLLQDGEKALALLMEAIQQNKKIIVYGDYDCDGIGACAASVLGLRHLGANVTHFTNNRFNEGYGMNIKGLTRLFETHQDIGLILTVDNGISVTEEIIQKARTYGAKIVITDHHEPPADGSLPSADAVVNPKRHGSTYPFNELCGAGIAYKLLIALAWEMGAEMQPIFELVDIVGISTVGDVVPLVDENRIIVKESLRLAREGKRPIINFLKEVSQQSNVTEETYGYTFAPMINAVGRITGEVSAVIEMFVSEDQVWQRQMAQYLVDMNQYRKALTLEQQQLASDLIQDQLDDPIILLKSNDFHEGIVGLIAGQLKERYYRPVFILSEEVETETSADGGVIEHLKIKGSARSIEGFHLKDMLDECREFLAGYGGHAAAAGLTVKSGYFDLFCEAIRQLARQHLTPELLTPHVLIDIALKESELTFDLMDQLDAMRPFGVGFEKPVIALKEFEIKKHRYIGTDSQHLKLQGSQHESILFNYSSLYQELNEPKEVQVLGYPEINYWNGKVSIQFKGTQLKGPQMTLF